MRKESIQVPLKDPTLFIQNPNNRLTETDPRDNSKRETTLTYSYIMLGSNHLEIRLCTLLNIHVGRNNWNVSCSIEWGRLLVCRAQHHAELCCLFSVVFKQSVALLTLIARFEVQTPVTQCALFLLCLMLFALPSQPILPLATQKCDLSWTILKVYKYAFAWK